MEYISLPQKVDVKELDPGKEAQITIEPCYPGYGTTLGNALRRVLLSSLPGAAVTAVKMKGVGHEFSTIPSVKEDVVDIILNLKLVRLRVHSEESLVVKLRAKGEKVVTAGDIEKNAQVEVMNPDQVIATLTDPKAVIEMELTVRQGVGYQPVESREKENLEIGMIAIDALYNPVRRVSFRKEDVRVGQMTNFDRLILNIQTDGSLTPIEAFEKSSSILVEHFALLRDFSKLGEEAEKESEKSGDVEETKADAEKENVPEETK